MIDNKFLRRRIQEKPSQEDNSSAYKTNAQEKKEDSSWDKMKLKFATYLTRMFNEYGVLEYPKPLSLMVDQRAEIEANRENSRIISSEDGGPTKEQIYASALKVARQFGWQEAKPQKQERVFEMGNNFFVDENGKISERTESGESTAHSPNPKEEGIPVFVTNRLRADLKSFGITDAEIDMLKPKEAWELLEIKNTEKEAKEPKQKRVYTLDTMSQDFSLLQKMWDEAYENMDNVAGDSRATEMLNLTAKTIDDSKSLEEYLQNNHNIIPEEKFFIEMSIQIKKFRAKGRDKMKTVIGVLI